MSLVFLHPPADIIRWLMIDLGLGTNPSLGSSWPIYYSSEPDTPDEVITVYNTTGIIDGRSSIDGEIWEHYGFQVRVRSTKNRLARVKIDSIARSLSETAYNSLVTIDGNSYIVAAINRKGSVIDIGKETPTSERSVFTLNAISAIYRKS